MVKKEGSDGQKAAFKAYKAAREEHDDTAESGEGDKVSSALINRVRPASFIYYYEILETNFRLLSSVNI